MRINIDVRPEDISIFRKASRVQVGEEFGLKDTTTYRVALSRLVVDVMEAVDKAEGADDD